MIARVFPFSIYYRVVSEVIFVDAVVDKRKDPASIKRLLQRMKRDC